MDAGLGGAARLQASLPQQTRRSRALPSAHSLCLFAPRRRCLDTGDRRRLEPDHSARIGGGSRRELEVGVAIKVDGVRPSPSSTASSARWSRAITAPAVWRPAGGDEGGGLLAAKVLHPLAAFDGHGVSIRACARSASTAA